MTPPITVSQVNDIEPGWGGRTIVATDKGVLVHQNNNWTVLSSSSGLSDLHIQTLEPVGGKFYYSALNKTFGQSDFSTTTSLVVNNSASYGHISAIQIDNPYGDTLFGTDNGIVWWRTGAGQMLVNFGVPLGRVVEINYLTNGTTIEFYVIATTDKIALYEPGSNTKVIVDKASSPLPSNNVLSNAVQAAVSYDGTDRGLYIADFTGFPTIGTSVISRANTAIPSDTIQAVAVSGSNLFLGTPKGFAARINNTWRTYTAQNSNLPEDDIVELAMVNGEVWLGTKSGQLCKAGISDLVTSVMEAHTFSRLRLYPNPATTKVWIKGDIPLRTAYTIYDVSGRQISTGIVDAGTSSIDLPQVAPGMYVLKLIASGCTTTLPIHIEKSSQ